MTLQSRTPFIESFEFFDREKSSQRHNRVLADRRMTFGKNKPVTLRPFRFLRLNFHYAKVECYQNVHRREWPAYVPSSTSCNGTNRQPPTFTSKCLQLLIIYCAIHICSWLTLF